MVYAAVETGLNAGRSTRIPGLMKKGADGTALMTSDVAETT